VIVRLIFVNDVSRSRDRVSIAGKYILDDTGDVKAASEAIYTYTTRCHFGKMEYGGVGCSASSMPPTIEAVIWL
jgi:hypothetical protein